MPFNPNSAPTAEQLEQIELERQKEAHRQRSIFRERVLTPTAIVKEIKALLEGGETLRDFKGELLKTTHPDSVLQYSNSQLTAICEANFKTLNSLFDHLRNGNELDTWVTTQQTSQGTRTSEPSSKPQERNTKLSELEKGFATRLISREYNQLELHEFLLEMLKNRSIETLINASKTLINITNYLQDNNIYNGSIRNNLVGLAQIVVATNASDKYNREYLEDKINSLKKSQARPEKTQQIKLNRSEIDFANHLGKCGRLTDDKILEEFYDLKADLNINFVQAKQMVINIATFLASSPAGNYANMTININSIMRFIDTIETKMKQNRNSKIGNIDDLIRVIHLQF